jgi:glycosyltransferase involved in cell wall biosynthesis
MVGSRETGNETYVKGLVSGFSQLSSELDLFVYHVGRAWGADARHVRFRPMGNASPWVRLSFGLSARAARDSLDVLHVTYTAPLWAPCPIVVTVHDISYVEHPEWFSRRDLRVLSATVPMAIRKARRVITVSEVCRAEIMEHYRVPPEKVVAIPNAAGPASMPLSDNEARQELATMGVDWNRPYVLAVGNLQPRKNLVRLIGAIHSLAATGVELDLLIVGPEHYRAEEVLGAARESTARIGFTGYVTDRQLAACYSCASVFAFPSLFEGFGIPLLEAMAHGVPIACSQAGAFPEVCGDAALYFDPLEVDSIADALTRAVTDSALRQELIRKGRARERQFTWAKSAESTLAVYRRAARASAREAVGK